MKFEKNSKIKLLSAIFSKFYKPIREVQMSTKFVFYTIQSLILAHYNH